MTSEQIMHIVNKEYDLDVSIKTRKREVVYAKKIYIKLAREATLETLEQIGKNLNMPHDNVLYHLRKLDCIYDSYKKKCNQIIKKYKIKAQYFEKEEQVLVEQVDDTSNKAILEQFNELSTLSYDELREFRETRIKPFLMMLKSRKKHKKIEKVAGARLLR